MTRLAIEHDAVNLAQGFPDFGAPEEIKRAAQDAIAADVNQYAITWGAKPFRDAIAAKYRKWYGLDYDPEREITVCCGATEGMIATLLAVTNPGDEMVIFEPYYENYGPDTLLCDARTQVRSIAAAGLDIRSATNCAARSRRRPRRSSLTRRTTRPARYSRARSWK